MKECYKAILLIVIESLLIGGSYFYLMRSSRMLFSQDAAIVIGGVILGIAVGNIILFMPVKLMMKYVGMWALISFAFLIVLMWTAMFGLVEHSLETLLVLSSSASFTIVGMKWMLERMFKEDTMEDDLEIIRKIRKLKEGSDNEQEK